MLRRVVTSFRRGFYCSAHLRQIRHGPDGQVYRIWFDRESKYNAITQEMFEEWAVAVRAANQNKDTHITVMSGVGKFYTAGSDLQPFETMKTDAQRTQLATEIMATVEELISEFIEHEKPMIAFVNGPCVGIGVTTVGLCDMVLVSDKAYFWTPFTNLGYTMEGCASYTFSHIMGPQLAFDVLCLARRLSAQEALEARLVTRIFPDSEFRQKSEDLLKEWLQKPKQTLCRNKQLMRRWDKKILHEVNKHECKIEVPQWTTDECKNAMERFLSRRK